MPIFSANRSHQRAGFAGNQGEEKPRLAAQRDPHHVGEMELLEFLAAGAPPETAVGQDAVNVEGNRLNLVHVVSAILCRWGRFRSGFAACAMLKFNTAREARRGEVSA